MAKAKTAKIVANNKNEALPKLQASNNTYYYIALAAVLLLIFVIRSNFVNVPFERDEGSYAYCGKILLNGAIPFKDIGSQRLPGVFYCYAVIVAVFGYTLKSLHIAFMVINLLSTVLIFFIARKLFNNLGAISAAIFWALLSMNMAISGFTTQSEHLVAFFALAGIFCLVKYFDKRAYLWAILCGLSFSLAFEVKQTSFFLGLCAGVVLVARQVLEKPRDFKKGIISGILFMAAVIIPVVIDLFVVWKRGGWEDFNYWFFDIRKEYSSVITFDQGIEYLKMSFKGIYENYKFIWVMSFLGSLSIFITQAKWWIKFSVLCFFVCGFLTVTPGNHYYGHYFLQWVPTVCISAAAFIYSAEELLKFKLKLQTSARYIVLGILLLFSFSNLKALQKYYFKVNSTQLLRQVYGLNPFPESKVIADKLNTMLKPEDKIAVFGNEIQMYLYTNRISPSRFAGSGSLLEFNIKKAEEWQKEFISDVEKANPRFLVFYSHPISWCANPNVKNLIFPWFDKFTAQKYNLIGFADMYDNTTNYVWVPNMDLVNNPPKSQYKIFVFERK